MSVAECLVGGSTLSVSAVLIPSLMMVMLQRQATELGTEMCGSMWRGWGPWNRSKVSLTVSTLLPWGHLVCVSVSPVKPNTPPPHHNSFYNFSFMV